MAVLPYRDEVLASNNFIYYGDSVPSSGDFNAGDFLFVVPTSSATPTGVYPSLWRCTTASSAHNGGTWTAVATGVSVGTAIASAATIAPVTTVVHVTGTTTINTITVPTGFPNGGTITLIPDGLWSTGTSGNIAIATTGVVSKALIMTYDSTAGKFFPSY